MSLKNACDFISNLSVGRSIRQRQYDADRLIALVTKNVPSELREYLVHARVDDDLLKVTVSSAAVATRLRFLSTVLLDATTSAGLAVNSVSVHVMPGDKRRYLQKRPTLQPLSASAQTAQSLERMAGETEDDEMQTALKRLARAMRKSGSNPGSRG